MLSITRDVCCCGRALCSCSCHLEKMNKLHVSAFTFAETKKTVRHFHLCSLADVHGTNHCWVMEKCATDCAPRFKSSARERPLATQSVISKKYCKCKGFHQWTIGSVTILSARSVIDSDFTDIYLQGNLIIILIIISKLNQKCSDPC